MQGNASIASPVRRAGLSRGMQMNPSHHAAAPAWPPTLESYDYLSSLVARDWAWEGLQQVVLRANQASIQLAIEGVDVTVGPVAIKFLVAGFDAAAKARDQLDLLDRVLSPNRAPSSVLPRWTTRTKNLRDALITLDGRRAGASLKEIAILICGAEDVDADWGVGLRQRMQRHYSRGEALAAGRYRDFLR